LQCVQNTILKAFLEVFYGSKIGKKPAIHLFPTLVRASEPTIQEKEHHEKKKTLDTHHAPTTTTKAQM
jgi:hypothetical protein